MNYIADLNMLTLSLALPAWVFLSSRVGRVRILMFTSLCQFGLGVSVAFSGNYYFFVVLRFLLAMVSSVFVCAVCGCVSVCVLACNWGKL